jgi:hypothetical protein
LNPQNKYLSTKIFFVNFYPCRTNYEQKLSFESKV